MSSSIPTPTPGARPSRKDPTWKYGISGNKKGEVTCTECGKWMIGGINKLKYHIAKIIGQNLEICLASTPEMFREMKALLAGFEMRKEEKQKTKEVIAAALSSPTTLDALGGPSPRQHSSFGKSPEVSFSTASQIPPLLGPNYFIPQNVSGARPSLEGTGWNKEKHHEARMAATNFWYYNNLPFNAANNPYLEGLINAFTVIGKEFKAPTAKDLSGPLLQEVIKITQVVIYDQIFFWRSKGCSILSDES
ncbi:uncharacterized protein LOC131859404 [Cryptomeria japonica]|uniref:uncharacterized protein LOC131859404 n=1 Tax=Cryptomeria japonica TaxID=3369 RepID=UPI0027D9F9E8|nr:uncharacterized protein LOC131859404 [Cryptomeria japonica]